MNGGLSREYLHQPPSAATGDETRPKSSVLFICTANLCRSPIAAALLGVIVAQDPAPHPHWQISSAGTWTKPGLPAPEGVVEVLALRGLNLAAFRSRVVNHTLLCTHALVLTMEAGHKEALRVEFPDQAAKIYLLSEMSGLSCSIADPRCHNLHDYEQVVNNMNNWLVSGKNLICKLAVEH